jgi:hypothetical protein
MNYNILAYIIYSTITIYITVIVGYKFHKNGLLYIVQIIKDEAISISINNVLLVLYYCLNIGYVVLIISTWETTNNFQEMMNSIGTHTGTIIMLLALMHYFNLTWIYLINKYKLQTKN